MLEISFRLCSSEIGRICILLEWHILDVTVFKLLAEKNANANAICYHCRQTLFGGARPRELVCLYNDYFVGLVVVYCVILFPPIWP